MTDYQHQMTSLITTALMAALKEKKISPKILSKKEVNEKGLGNTVSNLEKSFSELSKKLYEELVWWHPEAAFKILANTGKIEAQDIKNKTGSDLLLLTQLTGHAKTDGSKIGNFFLGSRRSRSEPDEAISMTLGIVNAATGDLLWINSSSLYEKDSGLRESHDFSVNKKTVDRLLGSIMFWFDFEKNQQKLKTGEVDPDSK
jgi:hypothetical protein